VLQPPPPAALLSRFGRHHHDALMLRLVKVLQVRALCNLHRRCRLLVCDLTCFSFRR
jgi:hypothetical protein